MQKDKQFAKNVDGERLTMRGIVAAYLGIIIGFIGFCSIFVERDNLLPLGMLAAIIGLHYDTIVNRFKRWLQKRQAGR